MRFSSNSYILYSVVLAPMIMGFITSFFNYTMTSFTFVGFDNYIPDVQ